jgi:hypothetical protein
MYWISTCSENISSVPEIILTYSWIVNKDLRCKQTQLLNQTFHHSSPKGNDGDSKLLWNVNQFLPYYAVQYHSRHPSSTLLFNVLTCFLEHVLMFLRLSKPTNMQWNLSLTKESTSKPMVNFLKTIHILRSMFSVTFSHVLYASLKVVNCQRLLSSTIVNKQNMCNFTFSFALFHC